MFSLETPILCIIVFKDKVSDFIDRHLFYTSGNIKGIQLFYIGNTKRKKRKNSIKNEGNKQFIAIVYKQRLIWE